MKPISNHLLVRLTKKTDELQLGDVTMYVDTSYETQRHSRIVGEVVQVPSELYYKNLDHSGLKWDTEMEAKIGDEVILHFAEVTWSIKEGKSYEEDGHLFLYIKYDTVIVAKRKVGPPEVSGVMVMDEAGQAIGVDIYKGWEIIKPSMSMGAEKTRPGEFSYHESTPEELEGGAGENYKKDIKFTPKPQIIWDNGVAYEIIMLNGYILVEQDKERYETVLYIPEELQEKKALTGVIRFIGSSNKHYHDEFDARGISVNGDLADDRFDLKVGDRISFQQYADIDLEYSMHRTFMGTDGAFVKMQRNKIYCKL